MRDSLRDFESLARAVEALEPYLDDLVFVGGWAHFLYTLRPEAVPLPFEVLHTEDADVAAPQGLAPGPRPIAECLVSAGFREELSSDHRPPISEYVLGDDAGGFYLEFLSPLVGGEFRRDGTRDATTRVGGVTAQKLRHVELLLTSPWTVTLARKNGFPVSRRRTVRVPNPVSYIVQKILVLPRRPPAKRAKDLLYIHDTFALFADSLDGLASTWTDLRHQMVKGHVRSFEKRARSELGGVGDLTRRAAQMAATRVNAPTPEQLLAGLRSGFGSVFKLRA